MYQGLVSSKQIIKTFNDIGWYDNADRDIAIDVVGKLCENTKRNYVYLTLGLNPKKDKFIIRCSNCQNQIVPEEYENVDLAEDKLVLFEKYFEFCPKCGMRLHE